MPLFGANLTYPELFMNDLWGFVSRTERPMNTLEKSLTACIISSTRSKSSSPYSSTKLGFVNNPGYEAHRERARWRWG
jgi:hypothetical protein